MFMGFQLDLLMGVFGNIRSFGIRPALLGVCSLLSLGICAYYFYFIMFLLKKSLLLETAFRKFGSYDSKKIKRKIRKWAFLKEELDVKSKRFSRCINEILMIKDFFLGFFIILFLNHPWIQLVPNILIYFCSSVIIINFRPYENKRQNFLMAWTESLYTLILVAFLAVKVTDDYWKLQEKNKYYYLGYSIIILMVLTLFIDFIVSMFEIYFMIKKYCKKNWCKIKGKNKKKKVRGIFYFLRIGLVLLIWTPVWLKI
jgi:hypothetical protein